MPSAQDCAERLREQAYRTLLPQIRDLEQELQSSAVPFRPESSKSNGSSKRFASLSCRPRSMLSEVLDEVIRQKDLETDALVFFARSSPEGDSGRNSLASSGQRAQVFPPRSAFCG